MLARKALSLLAILSFVQAFAAGSICDTKCFLAHTDATATHPSAAHHHHSASDSHSRHEHAGHQNIAAATSPGDEMAGVHCSTACVSKANVNGNVVVERVRLLPTVNAERATLIVIAAWLPDQKVLFPQARSSPFSAILRI